jgi:hypothetical protein
MSNSFEEEFEEEVNQLIEMLKIDDITWKQIKDWILINDIHDLSIEDIRRYWAAYESFMCIKAINGDQDARFYIAELSEDILGWFGIGRSAIDRFLKRLDDDDDDDNYIDNSPDLPDGGIERVYINMEKV